MKKSLPYEIIAGFAGILGAFLLVGVYMPIINPVQTKIETHQESPSLGYYFIMTPIPLMVLAVSWYFNRKAQRLKQDEKAKKHNDQPSA